MDKIFAETADGITGIANDLVVHGKSVREYDISLHRLMHAALRFGLEFRYEKCTIRREEVNSMAEYGQGPQGRVSDPMPQNVMR